VKFATGHARVEAQAQCGKLTTGIEDESTRVTGKGGLKLGTWNVRGLLQPGKLEIVQKEVERVGLDVFGLSETHWRGNGHFRTDEGNMIYFSGPEDNSYGGVAVMLSDKYEKALIGYNPINDRIIHLKLNTTPCKMHIVQVYAPTSSSEDNIIEAFYEKMDELMSQIPTRDVTIIMGDMNAKVGRTTDDNHLRSVIGGYGMGERNERGERLIQFCNERKLTVMNTCFKHHVRRLYTWVSPGDRWRNQIDYILINQRWRSSILNVKTYPGADCGSDHQLLVAKLRLKLKTIKRNQIKPNKLNKNEALMFKNIILEKEDIMLDVGPTTDPNTAWVKMKNIITETVRECRTNAERPRNEWITHETWTLILERRKLKEMGLKDESCKAKYKQFHKSIKRMCRRDKNRYIEGICEEVEAHAYRNESRDLFQKVRMLTKEFKPQSWVVEGRDGALLTDVDDVLERWKDYCMELYQCDDTEQWIEDNENPEPDILRSEVEEAIRYLKTNKSPGIDNIPAELIKMLGEKAIKAIHDICNMVWKTGIWPRDWVHSTFVPLHKKGSTRKCENYRTVSLISHTSKILLRIINQRLKQYLDTQIPQEQAGFVKGKGTREQILNVRLLIEKSREFRMPLIFCFIDYTKAFDCVKWDHMWGVLIEMGVPRHLVNLIRQLYRENTAAVRVNGLLTSELHTQKGVRQGCILSPILFNIYGEYIMRRALDGWDGGVKVGGRIISNLRYADDTTIIAKSEQEMVLILQRIEHESRQLGLEMNKSKTKIMVVDRHNQLEISNTLNGMEVVHKFVYLGSLLLDSGDCVEEIKRRIAMAKNAMTRLDKIWKDRGISRATKVRLVRALVFPIFSYGGETWTIKARERQRIDAFEMWCWRRLLRIPWTARRTNTSILIELSITDRLSSLCLKQVLRFFGHIARRGEESLEKLVVLGGVEGSRGRGRAPTRWTDRIRAATGTTVVGAVRMAMCRERWRTLIHDVVTAERVPGHDPQ
jgi:hypothetical protein